MEDGEVPKLTKKKQIVDDDGFEEVVEKKQ